MSFRESTVERLRGRVEEAAVGPLLLSVVIVLAV